MQIEQLRDLVTSPGWQWLWAFANAHFSSVAMLETLGQDVKRIKQQSGTLEQLGAQTVAQLATRDAIMTLLGAPDEQIRMLREERHRRQQLEEEQ